MIENDLTNAINTNHERILALPGDETNATKMFLYNRSERLIGLCEVIRHYSNKGYSEEGRIKFLQPFIPKMLAEVDRALTWGIHKPNPSVQEQEIIEGFKEIKQILSIHQVLSFHWPARE